MPYGTVKSFKDEKGFGIIGQDDGGEDLFVHFRDIDASGYRTLREGQRVSYEVISGQNGKKAAGVRDIGPRQKSFLDKINTGGYPVKTNLTIDGFGLDERPASPGSDDARKTHNKLPEAVHPMTPNSLYVRAKRKLTHEAHKTFKDNLQQELENSLKGSADSLRKSLEQGEKDRQASLEMALEAKRQALRDWSEQQQEPFEQKGRSQGDFPGMSHAETMVPSEINIKSAPVSKEKISEQPQSIVFNENSLTPLEQVHLRPGLEGYAFTSSKESSNTVMPGDFESTTYSKSHLPESSPSQPAEANTSHYFRTLNPAYSRLAGYASTQTDSASRLFEKAIAAEARAEAGNISKMLPHTADSDYEPSEFFGGEGSIFSLPESISSKSSIHVLLGPTEEFVTLLIDQTELPTLYPTFCQAFEFADFKSKLHHLLKVFSRDLSKEASIPVEKESVRFISQQRRRISHAVGREVFGLKQQSLFQPSAEQQQLDNNEKIEQYLRGVAQSKSGDNEEPVSAQEDQNSDNDSSDDEAESSVLPKLDQVRNFLIESKALEKLRINLKKLAEQQKTSSMRHDAKCHGELKDREGPKPNELMEGKENEGNIVQSRAEQQQLDNNEKIEQYLRGVAQSKSGDNEEPVSAQEDQNSDNDSSDDEAESSVLPKLDQVRKFLIEKEQISPNHLRYVEDVKTELQVRAGSRLVSSSGLKETMYRVLARHFRPTVKAGYKRLEWKCDCGITLYGDFFAHNSIEIDKLGEELGAYGYEGQSKHGNKVKTVPTGQGQSNQPSPGPIAPQRSTGNQTTPTQPTTPAAALPASHPTNPGLGTTIPPPRPPPPPVIRKYTALCVNTGEFNKTLGEIDISFITTDRQMFHRFKEVYHELRGFRARAVRWFLIKPVDIKFIQFSVEDSHRVDIIPEPPDCTICATDADVRSRQYEPHLHTSARTHPPISADAFLHYWQCHSKERSLQRTKWLNRLPRKLDKKLEDLRRVTPTDDDVLGWGIHVIEGLNTALVTFLTFLMLLISGVISLWFSIWNSDVSGGFAIGAYMVALWVAFITALYFQWKRE